MNRTFFFFLTGLCLLIVALACRHTPDVVVPMLTSPINSTVTPPVAATPAASTTATSPPISFSFGEGPTPVNLANCRVIQQVTKVILTSASKPYIDMETVVIAGQSYTVASDSRNTYQYDSQGRLVKEIEERYKSSNPTIVTTYSYYDGLVLQENNNKRVDTLLLNAQGFVSRNGYYDSDYTYNQEGFKILVAGRKTVRNTRYIIENGNTTKSTSLVYFSGGTWTETYFYNLSQKNTVTNTGLSAGLYGMPDRNVRTGLAIETKNISPEIAPNGEIYKADIHTEFDRYGRVKRTIQINTFYAQYINIPMGPNVNVIDYQYECP